MRTELHVLQLASRERHPFLLPMRECFQTAVCSAGVRERSSALLTGVASPRGFYDIRPSQTRLVFVTDYIPGGDLMLHIQRAAFSYERTRYDLFTRLLMTFQPLKSFTWQPRGCCVPRFYAAEVLLALEFLHKNNVIYRYDQEHPE